MDTNYNSANILHGFSFVIIPGLLMKLAFPCGSNGLTIE